VKNLVSNSAPPWKTNNPLGSYGNSVRIKPDTQIFMKLSGQITLSQNPNSSQTTYSIVVDNQNDKNNLLNIYKNISSSLRKSESGEKLNGSYNFNIVSSNSYYNNQKADDSPLNLEQILRRNLVVFKKFPPQLNQSLYDYPQAINPDLSSLIMCDNSQYSNEKTKIKCSYTTNSESIAKAYGINNENENTFGTAGGFVRSNSVDYSSKDEFQNVLESITLNDSNPTGTAQGVLVGADSYINLRIDDRSCSNYKVDVAIKDGANDVYKINNLSLNPNYSSFDIPFYNGSSINITPSDRIPTSNLDNQPCYKKIDILAKKYRDIIMPTSGFVEFKMHVTGANPTCKLSARIINPQGEKKLITKTLKTSLVQQSYIFGNNINFNKTPDTQNLEVEKVVVGLSNYGDSKKSSIIKSNLCADEKIDVNNCKLSDPSCNIPSGSQSKSCQDGNGNNADISGYGGGGGGNIGGEKGKNGTSFINPEFASFVKTSSFENNGNGNVNDNGQSGKIILQTYNENNGQYEDIPSAVADEGSLVTVNISKDAYKCSPNQSSSNPRPNCIYFRIAGGAGGGLGTNCGSNSGFNGDKFEGEIDLSEYFVSQATIALKLQSGHGGIKGNDCPNSALNTENLTPYLKGGKGMGGGGNGGSASYIFITRNDEAHNNSRSDFLVIAGGGGGASISGLGWQSYIYPPSNALESSAFGIKVGVKFRLKSDTVYTDEQNDYYHEYLHDSDPFNDLQVTTDSLNKEHFVRKGQIIRIYPEKSFFQQSWSIGSDSKECGVGMIFKITPRPAVLCSISPSQTFQNPQCWANYLAEQDLPPPPDQSAITSSSSTVTAKTQYGCLSTINCAEDSRKNIAWNEYILAGNKDDGIKVTESAYCPRQECYKLNCSGGSATEKRNCTTSSPGASCNGDPTKNIIFTPASCSKCQELRFAELNASPVITGSLPVCYDFANSRNLSFQKKYGASFAPTDVDKTTYSIREIQNYGIDSDDMIYGRLKVKKDYQYSSQGAQSSDILSETITFPSSGRVFGLIVNDASNFKDLKFNSPIPNSKTELVFDLKSLPTYQNGEYLDISLCKETNDGSCESSADNPDFEVGKLIKWQKDPGGGNPKQTDDGNKFIFNGLRELQLLDSSYPVGINECSDKGEDNKSFLCFTDDSGNVDEIAKYRLAFRIKDPDESYVENIGKYNVEVSVKKPDSSKLELVNKILNPIFDKIDGDKDKGTPGLASSAYYNLISSYYFRNILNLTVILLFSFYGLGYLIGTNELKHSEITRIILKVGIVYLFTSPTLGYVWFEKFFIQFFKNSVDMMSFWVAQTFENSELLANKIAQNDFSDKSLMFISTDKVFSTLLSSAVQNKILALIFSSIWGWVYFLIIFHCVLLYFYAIANSILLFITCQVINSILLTLAPIIFLLIFFNITKEIFDNWLKSLIGFSLQQIFLVLTLSFFNILFLEFLKLAIGYRVCWSDVLTFTLLEKTISLMSFWTIAGTNSESTFEDVNIESSFGNSDNTPSLYAFLTLWIVVGIMKKFIELFTDLAVSISGGIKASTVGGDVAKASKALFGAVSSKANSLFKATIGRVVDNADNFLFASGKIADQKRQESRIQFANDMKMRSELLKYGNNAISEYKKDHALELSKMSHAEQKIKLRDVRDSAMKNYAMNNNINNFEKLMNSTGLNYTGNNLIGAAFQAGRQAVTPGGNLINSSFDKTVKTSFSKTEASEAMKRMDKLEKQDKSKEKDEFLKNIKDGNLKVNMGKFEIAKKPHLAIRSSFNSFGKVIKKSVKMGGKDDYKRAVFELSHNRDLNESQKIKTLKGGDSSNPIIKGLVNLARTDKEKELIRNKIREYKKEREVFSDKDKKTNNAVIQDLEITKNYIEKKREYEKEGGIKSMMAEPRAVLGKNIDRIKGIFVKKSDDIPSKNDTSSFNKSELEKTKNHINELDKKIIESQNNANILIKNDPLLKLIDKITENKPREEIKNEIQALKDNNDLIEIENVKIGDKVKTLTGYDEVIDIFTYDIDELYPSLKGKSLDVIEKELKKYSAVIDYIDVAEEEGLMIGNKLEDIERSRFYTNIEIEPSIMLGVLGNLIVYPEHNQLPRNAFSCGQSKQAVSVYHTNYQMR
ncbi:MAG: hypothetical protein EBS92_05645, partial [Proteobacteria bacterium]|nr:hypothetical protein [Pseudomonadota bacterium]